MIFIEYNIDSISLSELKNKYGNVLGNYNTYQVTGYFNPLQDVVTTKLKTGDVEVLDSGNKHHRSLQYVTPPAEVSQKLLDGPRADTLRFEVPKSKPDFYVTPDGITYSPTQYDPRVVENLTENLAISTGKKIRRVDGRM